MFRRVILASCAAALAACATGTLPSHEAPPADPNSRPVGPSNNPPSDVPPVPGPVTPPVPGPVPPPAPPPMPSPDVPPTTPGRATKEFTQTASMEPDASAPSLSCHVGGNPELPTRTQSFFRLFKLSNHVTKYTVTSVVVGITKLTSTRGPLEGEIKLYTYDGNSAASSLDPSKLTLVVKRSVSFGTVSTPTIVSFDIEGVFRRFDHLVVEVAVKDGEAVGGQFIMGTNRSVQEADGYVWAPACGQSVPTMPSVYGRGAARLLIGVRGVDETP